MLYLPYFVLDKYEQYGYNYHYRYDDKVLNKLIRRTIMKKMKLINDDYATNIDLCPGRFCVRTFVAEHNEQEGIGVSVQNKIADRQKNEKGQITFVPQEDVIFWLYSVESAVEIIDALAKAIKEFERTKEINDEKIQ